MDYNKTVSALLRIPQLDSGMKRLLNSKSKGSYCLWNEPSTWRQCQFEDSRSSSESLFHLSHRSRKLWETGAERLLGRDEECWEEGGHTTCSGSLCTSRKFLDTFAFILRRLWAGRQVRSARSLLLEASRVVAPRPVLSSRLRRSPGTFILFLWFLGVFRVK